MSSKIDARRVRTAEAVARMERSRMARKLLSMAATQIGALFSAPETAKTPSPTSKRCRG